MLPRSKPTCDVYEVAVTRLLRRMRYNGYTRTQLKEIVDNVCNEKETLGGGK